MQRQQVTIERKDVATGCTATDCINVQVALQHRKQQATTTSSDYYNIKRLQHVIVQYQQAACLLVCGLKGCVGVRARWREKGERGRRESMCQWVCNKTCLDIFYVPLVL